MAARAPNRIRYRHRIGELLKKKISTSDGPGLESELQAHWAKYTCVLISGFLEQSIKEILLEHVAANSQSRIKRYVDTTWPNSKNMRADAIRDMLDQFDESWGEKFTGWVNEDERKKEVNEIIKWRNDIAHGNEANTNNVTRGSVLSKFKVACDLVDFIERLPTD